MLPARGAPTNRAWRIGLTRADDAPGDLTTLTGFEVATNSFDTTANGRVFRTTTGSFSTANNDLILKESTAGDTGVWAVWDTY